MVRYRSLALAFALALVLPTAARAACSAVPQSTPEFTAGGSVFAFVAAQWNQFFAAKVDALNGTLCNPTILGGSITGQTLISPTIITPSITNPTITGFTSISGNLTGYATALAGSFAASHTGLAFQGTLSGTGTDPGYTPFAMIGMLDTAANASGGAAIQSLFVYDNISSGAGGGNRAAITAALSANAPTGGAWNSGLNFFTGVFGQAYVNSNDKGIVTNYTGNLHNSTLVDGMSGNGNCVAGYPISAAGGVFPAGTYIVSIDSSSQIHISQPATSGASGVTLTCGRATGDYYGVAGLAQINYGVGGYFLGVQNEFDTSVQAGNQVDYNFVLSAVLVNSHAVHANLQEAYLEIERDVTTLVGMNCGICFGSLASLDPLDATNGIVMGAYPSASALQAKGGIDLTPWAFNSFSLKMPGGMSVDYQGTLILARNYPVIEFEDFAGTATITNGGLQRFLGLGDGCMAQQTNFDPTGNWGSVGTPYEICGGTMIINSPQLPFGIIFNSPVTVAALPSCTSGIKGTVQMVSDANSPTYLGTLTGGGSTETLARCNGTNWVST